MRKSGIASARRYGLTVSESRIVGLGANRDGKSPLAATTSATTTGKDRSPVVYGGMPCGSWRSKTIIEIVHCHNGLRCRLALKYWESPLAV